jgi:hypothetical protein
MGAGSFVAIGVPFLALDLRHKNGQVCIRAVGDCLIQAVPVACRWRRSGGTMNRFFRAVRQLCAAQLAGCAYRQAARALLGWCSRAGPYPRRAVPRCLGLPTRVDRRSSPEFGLPSPKRTRLPTAEQSHFNLSRPKLPTLRNGKTRSSRSTMRSAHWWTAGTGSPPKNRVKFRVLPRFPLWGRLW